MTLCQFFDKELQQVLSDTKDFDINLLDTSKYDDGIKTLTSQIETLKTLQNALGGSSADMHILDFLISQEVIDTTNLSSKNITSKIENINQDTMIFVGNLYYSLYQKHFITPLPEKLKYITGTLEFEYDNISSIEMEYIGRLKVEGSNDLDSISVKNLGSIRLSNCWNLLQLQLQTVATSCFINNCSKLKIDNI